MITTALPPERYSGLHTAFRALYQLPGARSLVRNVARVVIQSGRLSLLNRQRLYNFFGLETSAGVRVLSHVKVPGAITLSAMLNLDEDLDRNWYFWGYNGYERGVPELLRRLARERRYQTVIEIGANIGYFTLLLAEAVRHNGLHARVHAFEPFEPVYAQLETNVALNPILPITLHRAAVSDTDGEASLFVPTDERAKTNASLIKGLFVQNRTNRVSCVRLDSFTADTASKMVGPIDFLKMDCEGAEPAVIRGAERVLAEARPDIVCEVLPPTAEELDWQFTRLHYLKYRITDGGLVACERLVADSKDRDYLLTSKSVRADC